VLLLALILCTIATGIAVGVPAVSDVAALVCFVVAATGMAVVSRSFVDFVVGATVWIVGTGIVVIGTPCTRIAGFAVAATGCVVSLMMVAPLN